MDHSQTSSVSKFIQRGHKVDCPAYICVKEAFVLDDYNEVAYELSYSQSFGMYIVYDY